MARQWLWFGPLAGIISAWILIISASASAQETPQPLLTASEQITNGLIVAVDEPTWAAACNAEKARPCAAELPVVFTNRGLGPVRIERFEVVRMEGEEPLSRVEATVRVHKPTPRRIRIAPTARIPRDWPPGRRARPSGGCGGRMASPSACTASHGPAMAARSATMVPIARACAFTNDTRSCSRRDAWGARTGRSDGRRAAARSSHRCSDAWTWSARGRVASPR